MVWMVLALSTEARSSWLFRGFCFEKFWSFDASIVELTFLRHVRSTDWLSGLSFFGFEKFKLGLKGVL